MTTLASRALTRADIDLSLARRATGDLTGDDRDVTRGLLVALRMVNGDRCMYGFAGCYGYGSDYGHIVPGTGAKGKTETNGAPCCNPCNVTLDKFTAAYGEDAVYAWTLTLGIRVPIVTRSECRALGKAHNTSKSFESAVTAILGRV